MDEEACPAIVPAMGAPGMASSVRLTMGATVCPDDGPSCPVTDVPASADDGSSCAVSACGVMAVPSHVVPTMSAPDALSTAYPPIDAADGGASSVDHVVGPATLPPASGMAPNGPWRTCRRARVFFSASFKRVPRPQRCGRHNG